MFFTNFQPAMWQLHGLPGLCHAPTFCLGFVCFLLVSTFIELLVLQTTQKAQQWMDPSKDWGQNEGL